MVLTERVEEGLMVHVCGEERVYFDQMINSNIVRTTYNGHPVSYTYKTGEVWMCISELNKQVCSLWDKGGEVTYIHPFNMKTSERVGGLVQVMYDHREVDRYISTEFGRATDDIDLSSIQPHDYGLLKLKYGLVRESLTPINVEDFIHVKSDAINIGTHTGLYDKGVY